MAIIKETTKPAPKTYQLDISQDELTAINHALFIFNMEHTNPYGNTCVLQHLLAQLIDKKE